MDVDRLDRIESRIAIEELLAGYAHGFDLDPDIHRGLWHEDAVFDTGAELGCFSGVNEILRAVYGYRKRMKWMNHWMTTPSISIDGNHASGVIGYDSLVHERSGTRPIRVAGTYDDRYERRDGTWKFIYRRVGINFWNPVTDWNPTFGEVV